jgi:D-alanyl-D-alanine carboxypeptidase
MLVAMRKPRDLRAMHARVSAETAALALHNAVGMTNHRYLAPVSLLLGLAAAVAACSDDDTATFTPLTQTEIAGLEARAEAAVAAGIPGVVVVVKTGDQTVRIARGVSDRGTGAPMQADMRFRAASLAKSVTASLVLQLVDEGKLALDDTIDEVMPGLLPPGGNGEATIEQLLRQDSGLYDFAADPRHMQPYLEGNLEYAWNGRALVALAAEHAPEFAPGERFMYSNTNFALLGLIVEALTGQPLAEAARTRVFVPLEMEASVLAMDGQLEVPFARGYLFGVGDEPLDVTGISGSAAFGSGNLVSTGDDLIAFYGGLIAGRVVRNPALLDAMIHPVTAVHETSYGMGVFVWDTLWPCGTFVGHDGGIPGYDSVSYSSTDGGRQFTVMVNSLTPDDHAGDAAAHAAWGALVGQTACAGAAAE